MLGLCKRVGFCAVCVWNFGETITNPETNTHTEKEKQKEQKTDWDSANAKCGIQQQIFGVSTTGYVYV